MSTPSSNGKNGFVTKILDRVLQYADKPWRAAFVLVALIICGTGYVMWHERQALIKLLERRSEEHLSADLGPTITEVFYKTSADAVSIWSVNLGSSITEFIVGRRRSLEPWQITPRTMRVFTEASNPAISAKLLRGESACFEPATMRFPVALALTQDGIAEACIIPEPPSRTSPLIGVVILAWQTKPPEAVSDAAVAAVLKETAKIVVH